MYTEITDKHNSKKTGIGQPQKFTLSCSIVCLHWDIIINFSQVVILFSDSHRAHCEPKNKMRGNVFNMSKHMPKSSQRMKDDITKCKQTELD